MRITTTDLREVLEDRKKLEAFLEAFARQAGAIHETHAQEWAELLIAEGWSPRG